MESHTLAASVSQASVGGVMVSIVAFHAIDPVRFPANAVFLSFCTGESSTGGYTVYVGLDLESGETAMHSCVHGFCQSKCCCP